MKFNILQNFDYESNNLFKSFSSDVKLFTDDDEIEIFEAIKLIDIKLNYYLINACDKSVNEFKASIYSEIKKINNILISKNNNDIDLLTNQLTNTAIDLSIKHILFEANKVKVENFNDDRLTKFKKDGFYDFLIPNSDYFNGICDELLTSHRKMYEKEDDWRGANAFDGGSNKDKYFSFFENLIIENKIDLLVSQYWNAKCRIKYIASDYCHSRQKWFKNNHKGQSLMKTNYIHFDADPNISKMLIYLTDVTENDGPFRVVRSSNLQHVSLFLKYLHYSLELLNNSKFTKESDLFGRGLYIYRKDLLMKLPSILIGATHFGDDLVEGSLLYNYILDNLVTFKSRKGTCVLFDGFRSLHVGGNPISGERLAVQVAFEFEKKEEVKKRMIWFRK